MTLPECLICPKCGKKLKQVESSQSLKCCSDKPHCYDLSASGYVNLLPPGKMNNAKAGDGKEMLRARESFLSGGYYDRISAEIAGLIGQYCKKSSISILDAGCGEGYHICKIADLLEKQEKNIAAIGIDASKHGADIGSKAARKSGSPVFFAAANIFALPVADSSCDAVISMFAPVPSAEAARILRDDGILVVCSSGKRHLWEMRSILYGEPRENEKEPALPENFLLAEQKQLSYIIDLPDSQTIDNLFTMTPFYHRSPKDGRDRLMAAASLSVTTQAIISIYKKAKDIP